jgi:hypothetical protein
VRSARRHQAGPWLTRIVIAIAAPLRTASATPSQIVHTNA